MKNDDLGELSARVEGLEREQATLQNDERELEDISARLKDLDAKLADVTRRLPMLDDMRIASPCPADWNEMVGDERVRFCGQCRKNVYNVAALTTAEVSAILLEHEGEACMRLYRRADNTVITADCPVGRKRKRRRRMVAGAILAAGASYAAAYSRPDATRTLEVRERDHIGVIAAEVEEEGLVPLMGSVALPVPPAPER